MWVLLQVSYILSCPVHTLGIYDAKLVVPSASLQRLKFKRRFLEPSKYFLVCYYVMGCILSARAKVKCTCMCFILGKLHEGSMLISVAIL